MSIQDEMAKIEMVEGLQRALDNSWRRLREKARVQWESQFAGSDPSDACVRVSVSSGVEAQLPSPVSAGFLPRPRHPQNGKMQPRLA
jgi:hypothetical protein